MTRAINNDPHRPLKFALPKGRLLHNTLAALRSAGLDIDPTITETRKLILDISDASQKPLGVGMELLLLKNSDVPVYVEHGVADIGVAGTDALYEADVNVYRPFTFPFGSCTIALAAPKGVTRADLSKRPVLRVATKFRRFARNHFASSGKVTELIPLAGSVELAPELGLADAILDLVDSGRTLREHDLHIVETIGHTRVKLIANATIGTRRMAYVERLIALLAATQEQP